MAAVVPFRCWSVARAFVAASSSEEVEAEEEVGVGVKADREGGEDVGADRDGDGDGDVVDLRIAVRACDEVCLVLPFSILACLTSC